MVRPFEFFQKLGDLVAVPYPKGKGRHDKGLGASFLSRVHQAEAEQPIDGGLEGFAGAPLLLLHKPGNIIVDGQSGAHIMML